MPATVLVLVETINDYLPILEHQGFHLILAPTPAERAQAITTARRPDRCGADPRPAGPVRR